MIEMVYFIPPAWRRLVTLAAQADSAPVLIFGAKGTGKGAIAQWIHSNSPRSVNSFRVAHHEQPLITHIHQTHLGTLVIPELGERSLSEQKILLDFLNNKSIPHPEAPSAQMLVNTRIIATTSQALEGRAQGGLFNSELLEKLNVFRLEMPALSKRTEEFEDIIQGILAEIIQEVHKEAIKNIDAQAWNTLRNYNWPGNLRELRNTLRVAVMACQGDTLKATDLPKLGQGSIDFNATREEFEKTYILELLKAYQWQIDRTCQMTRIDKSMLLNKMKKYGISHSESTIP